MTVTILNSLYEFSKCAINSNHIYIRDLEYCYRLYGIKHASVVANYDYLSNSEKTPFTNLLLSHIHHIDHLYIIWGNPEPIMYNHIANKYPEALIW